MMQLCTVAAVEAGSPVLARLTPTTSVILLRLADGAVVAYRNACPHMGIELDWDPRRLLTPSGRYLRCTGHGAVFRTADGVCVTGPCAGEALTALPVRIEHDMVVLDDQAA
jgi:nitrite reductase/ring-hydroxylating ferredoxin subunit